MKKTAARHALLWALMCCALPVCAESNLSSYYASAKGKTGQELKSALAALLIQHKICSYNEVWKAYASTDVTAEGRIWDMYSNVSRFLPGGVAQGQAGGTEGAAYNREHSFPKSWWGNWNKGEAQYTDLFHVIPTDATVNSRRSNNAYGEVGRATFESHDGFSRLGPAAEGLGYTGTVFEPHDVYKGDIARQYFYMVTCYEDSLAAWMRHFPDNPMISGETYAAFQPWAEAMLLRWAQRDVVGPKEQARNEAVYTLQANRNPFVDFPGLEQYIWGNLRETPFDPDAYLPPAGWEAAAEESSLPHISTLTQTPSGKTYTFTKVTSASGIEASGTYVIVREEPIPCANGIPNTNQLSSCDVALADGSFTTSYINQVGFPYPFTLLQAPQNGHYLLQLADKTYITNGISSPGKHQLQTQPEICAEAAWRIDFAEDGVDIHNKEPYRGHIVYYASSKFFYANGSAKAGTHLYRLTSVTDVGDGVEAPSAESSTEVGYYNLQGIRCRPVRGIYLRRQGGEVRKVWIR